MAMQSQPSRIPEPFAGSGTKNTIPATNATPSASQAASWASGFPPECSQPISAGGCPVPRNDVNGALNQLSQDYAFRQDGGIWEWSALADYDVSRVVRGSDGKLYYAAQQSGPSVVAGAQDPTADDGTYWTAVSTDDAGIVHKTGIETINDGKFFTSAVLQKDEDYDISSAPSGTTNKYITFLDKNNLDICGMQRHLVSTYLAIKLFIRKYGDTTTSVANLPSVGFVCYSPSSYTFCPQSSSINLGLGNDNRWKQLYATTTTISTSDERKKSSISQFSDEVLDAWDSVEFVQFQFNDALAEKGAVARFHSGLIAQRIDEAFKAHGLDASRYALFCHDEWNAKPEERDENGNVVSPAQSAGDEFSLRYEEALCMEAAYQRRRADRAEARLAALEERLAAIEAKLNA